MPPKKLTVYPDQRALEILGSSAGALNQALECWADMIARATSENAEAFAPDEWCLIADANNGMLWEPRMGNPGVMIAANVQDGHRLNGTGYKWLGSDDADLAGSLHRVGAGKPTKEMASVDKSVAALVARLAKLDYVHAWAMLIAVQWFWDHCEIQFPPREVSWWRIPTRRKLEADHQAERN